MTDKLILVRHFALKSRLWRFNTERVKSYENYLISLQGG
jgi:hypothetical protein